MRAPAHDDYPGLPVTHLSFGSGVRRGPAFGSSPRPRNRLRVWFARRIGLFAAVALVAPITLTTGVAGAAAYTSPAPTPEITVPTLALTPLAHGVVAPGGSLTATVEVTNPTPVTLPGASVTIELSEDPLTTGAALDSWLDDGRLAGASEVIDTPAIIEVPPERSAGAVSVVAPDALASRQPGVYALSAIYGRDLETRSAVVLAGSASTAASIGMVVAVTAGPRTSGLITADELTELTGPEGRLNALLTAVTGTPAILAVDPAVLASIRILGDSAPDSASTWLERLESLPNERFALQFGDADVSVQVDAGLTTLLTPTDLSYARSSDGGAGGSSTSLETPTPSAASGSTETAAGSESGHTTGDIHADELLAVPGARASIYWPATGRAGEAALGVLARLPVATGPPATTLVSSADTTREGLQASARNGADASLLVYESATSAAVREAAASSSPAGPAAAAIVSARLALETAGATGSLLVTTERLDEVSDVGLRAAIDTVFDYPGVVPVTLAGLLGADPVAATSTARPQNAAATTLNDLLAGEADIARFSSIIDEPALLTGPERTSILQLIGAAWHERPVAWREAISEHATATQTTLTSVSVQQPSTVQLVSPEAVLPFFVRNDLPYAANVILFATPDSLRLNVERTTHVRAEPGVNTQVEVPVRARVGSGEVTIELRLVSPTLEQVGPIQLADVTVRAEWERIGIIGLGAIVALLLIAGLVRTVLRRRSSRRSTGADASDESTSAPRADGGPHG